MVEIRAMDMGDIPEVRRLVERTVRTSYRDSYSKQAIEFFVRYHGERAIRGDLRQGACLVAHVGGEIVGTATLRGNVVTRVFVGPERQGSGIGGALVRSLLDLARERKLELVRLDASLVSRTFYERLGFVVVADRAHDLGDGDVLPYHEMTLRL